MARRTLAALLSAALLAPSLPVHAQDDARLAAPASDLPLAAPALLPEPAPAPASAPTDARALAVDAAVDRLRADPALSGKRKTHELRWKDPDAPPERKRTPPDDSWFGWLRALAGFLSDTSRLLVYGIAIVLVALLVVNLRHYVALRQVGRTGKASAVSHVRDLDVRPESLPDDIGAEAWRLWQAGEVAAALSLLYRGALSRLIHRHEVPIGAATTEGECLDLARPRVDPAVLRYLTQLVRAWEASTYGGRTLSAAMGESLCSGFTARLDAAPAPAVPGASATEERS